MACSHSAYRIEMALLKPHGEHHQKGRVLGRVPGKALLMLLVPLSSVLNLPLRVPTCP